MIPKIFSSAVDYLFIFRDWAGGVLVPALPWLIVVSVIISGFFLWGIFYSISGSGYGPKKLDEYLDFFRINVGKRRQIRAWKNIISGAKSNNPDLWKKAILDADSMFDEILKMSGYRGITVHDRFQQLPREAISNYDQILAAHQVRDKIRQDEEFFPTQSEAIEVLKVYQKTFQELGLLD